MVKYQHISYAERVEIETLRNLNWSMSSIARHLGRSKSTIHDEIHRNTKRPDVRNNIKLFPYDAEWAERQTEYRWENVHRTTKLTKHWCAVLNEYLDQNFSLEQIAKGTRVPISTATLYSYAHQGKIRYRAKKYRLKKKPFHSQVPDTEFFAKHSIQLRSKRIETRQEFGHWEVDGVESPLGYKPLLITFVERKTRFYVAFKAKNKSTDGIEGAMENFLHFYGQYVRSMTFDRGSEFTNISNVLLLKKRGIKVYYADAYQPGQRGSNEERNKQIRKYFPKGTKFGEILQVMINNATHQINQKPLGVLNWHTPQDKFNSERQRIRRKTEKREKIDQKQ
jgi:IS30 family transposase